MDEVTLSVALFRDCQRTSYGLLFLPSARLATHSAIASAARNNMGRVLLSQVDFRAVAGLGGGREGFLAATIYHTGDFDSSPSDKARVDPEPPVMGSRDDRERDRVMLRGC